MKTLQEAEAVTSEQLKGITPSQIDELFAAVDERHWKIGLEIRAAGEEVHYAVGDRKRRGSGWGLTSAEAESKARGLAATKPTARAALDLARLDAARADLEALRVGVHAKLLGEFRRRGGWDRAWLVTDGHVHNTEDCPSCHNGEFRTRLHWMIEYSGKSEAEIIKAAGHRACTICYPSAPVAKGQAAPESVMFTVDEIERKKVREDKAAKAEAKKAKAEAGAITQPDGTPLRDAMGRDGEQTGSIVKTIRKARSELKQECWYVYAWGDKHGRHARNIQHLGRAVAWRENGLKIDEEPTQGQIDAIVEPLRAKAAKEVDKDRREAR